MGHESTFVFKGLKFSSKGVDQMTTLVVKDTDVPGSCNYTVSFTDAKGKRAKVQGLPTIVADNAAVVDAVGPVQDNGDDSFTANLHITDNPGAANITVTADADLGDGVSNVSFVDVVSVIPGDAVAGSGSFGAVTPDAPAPTV